MSNFKDCISRIERAEKMLVWCKTGLAEMITFGSSNDEKNIERCFYNCLSYISSAKENLNASYKGLPDQDTLRKTLERDIQNDNLLNYLKMARNSDVHVALTANKWKVSQQKIEFKLLDMVKVKAAAASRPLIPFPYSILTVLFKVYNQKDLFEKMDDFYVPSIDDYAAAGVEPLAHFNTLTLLDFESTDGKTRKPYTISAPKQHLGKDFDGTGDTAIKLAIKFYENKISNVRKYIQSLG